MEMQKMVAIQSVSTFFILLLISSRLAAQEMEYKSGPSPSPVESELDTSFIRACCKSTFKKELCYESLSPYASDIGSNPRSLCIRASWLAIQSLGNISRALSDLKGQPAELLTPRMVDHMGYCSGDLSLAESYINEALKEGSMKDNNYYELANRYNIAMRNLDSCALSNPIGHKVASAYDAAIFLISNARDLCSEF